MWGAGIDAHGCRRFVAALLLRACLDAAGGEPGAVEWLAGAEAKAWAELIDLERWPPTARQLGTKRELVRRARTLPTE